MGIDRDNLSTRMERVARDLASLARELAAIPVNVEAFDDAADSLPSALRQETCLICGKQLSGDRYAQRGLCGKDIQRVRRLLKRSPELEGDLIDQGLFLPERTRGRKRESTDALDRFLSDYLRTKSTPSVDSRVAQVEAALDEEAAKRPVEKHSEESRRKVGKKKPL